MYIWFKVFKNGLSKFCGRQPLKNLKWYALLRHKWLSFTNFTWSIHGSVLFWSILFYDYLSRNLNIAHKTTYVHSLYKTRNTSSILDHYPLLDPIDHQDKTFTCRPAPFYIKYIRFSKQILPQIRNLIHHKKGKKP